MESPCQFVTFASVTFNLTKQYENEGCLQGEPARSEKQFARTYKMLEGGKVTSVLVIAMTARSLRKLARTQRVGFSPIVPALVRPITVI